MKNFFRTFIATLLLVITGCMVKAQTTDTLHFYLSSEVVLEIRQPLFTPLWKHQPVLKDYVKYEADEDGYLTKMIYDSARYWVTYYYTTLQLIDN